MGHAVETDIGTLVPSERGPEMLIHVFQHIR